MLFLMKKRSNLYGDLWYWKECLIKTKDNTDSQLSKIGK